MIIFLVKKHGKFGAILDVDFPFNQITLRAEKALRVTCMRAVNRQPMFTARRTRRAFSFLDQRCLLDYPLRVAQYGVLNVNH